MMSAEEYFITFDDNLGFFFKETILEITPPSPMDSINNHILLSETRTLKAWWPYWLYSYFSAVTAV